MPQSHRLVRVAAFGCLFLIAACADPTGPIVGDWRGQDTAQSLDQQIQVEIILDGLPGASSGTYHYVVLKQTADAEGGSRRLDWTDQWNVQPLLVDGRQMQRVHLDRLAGPHIADFILTPDNTLVPLPDPTHPDVSRAALEVALHPVPRGSFGYGRP